MLVCGIGGSESFFGERKPPFLICRETLFAFEIAKRRDDELQPVAALMSSRLML